MTDRIDGCYDPTAGWVRVPGLVTGDEISTILDGCRRLLALPDEERMAGDRVGTGTEHLVGLDDRLPDVAAVLGRPPLLDAVTAIVDRDAESTQVSYRCPNPGFGGQQLHADDQPKLDDDPDRVVTAIVALVDFTTDNGSTRIVPGSHRRPDLQRLAGSSPTHPDEIVLTGPAGTAFVFSGHLLHAGGRNRSDSPRPALQLLWRRAGSSLRTETPASG